MSVRIVLAACATIALTSCLAAPPTRFDVSNRGAIAAHRSACAGKDEWSDPAPPIRIFGNLYDVGTCGITVLLITGPFGHVLIDGGPAEAATQVAANVENLGFRLRDVRWIVSSHEHIDHVGALAQLKRLSGAKVAAIAPASRVLVSGRPDPTDPQAGHLPEIEPVEVDRVLADGEAIELGNLRLVAHATPAHSPGSTSWTFSACEGRACRAVGYADSLTPISTERYRFSEHPAYVARFRDALNRVSALRCDILVTPHPSASMLFERLYGDAPLIDRQACAAYAAAGHQRLDALLAEEAKRR